MALEDLAMFRAVAGSTVFYPSDAVSCERAVELAARTPGICFIRTGRPATAILYKNDEPFQVGKGKVVRQNAGDKVVLVGAGVTLYEAIKASDTLKQEGIGAAVFDPFTVKPIDAEGLKAEAVRVGGRVVVVEDHYPAGGLGDAVRTVFESEGGIRVRSLAVTGLPRSGPSAVLLEQFGISASHIVSAAKGLLA
jgi:transketolase